MLIFKIDVLKELKDRGYTTTKLRKKQIIGEATIQAIRDNDPVSWKTIDILCELLHMQPGDMLLYEKDQRKGDSNSWNIPEDS